MHVYRRRLYTVIQSLLDALSFWPIWLCATQLRIAFDPLTQRQLTAAQASGWVAPIGLILPLCVAVSLRLNLYAVPREISPLTVLAWASENTLALCAVTVLATFFSRQFGASASRMFVLCMVPVAFLIFTATRCLALSLIAALQRKWQPPRIALIGDSLTAKRLIGLLELQIRSALRGVIVPEGTDLGDSGWPLPVLGTTGQLAELVNRERLDRVIMINSSLPDSELEHCNKVFWRMGLPVSSPLDLPAEPDRRGAAWHSKGRLELSSQYGLRMVEMRPVRSTRAQDLAKRALDFVISFLLLALLAPAMFLIGVIVKFSSKGPILERAPRVGKGGRHFTCLKFRTTYEDLSGPAPGAKRNTAGSAPLLTEPRATPAGRVLCRYGLDEVPQLINVLRSEMSLVGPRPLPAHELGPDGMSQEFFAWSETRARVRPGLTGLWQVGGRSNLSFDDMIRLDLEYIQNRSLALDLSLILGTPAAILRTAGLSRTDPKSPCSSDTFADRA